MRNPLPMIDASGVTVARQNELSRTRGIKNIARQAIETIGSQISVACKEDFPFSCYYPSFAQEGMTCPDERDHLLS